MSDEIDQIRELQVALGKETLPGQDVGQNRNKFVTVRRFSQREDIKIVVVNLFKFLASLRSQLQHSFNEHDCHLLTQFCDHSLGLRSLVIELDTIVLESSSIALSELRIPGAHAIF